MAELTYNNIKNANTSYISFEFYCKYHLYVFYKEDFDLYSKLKTAKKLLFELQKLITICQQNIYHV